MQTTQHDKYFYDIIFRLRQLKYIAMNTGGLYVRELIGNHDSADITKFMVTCKSTDDIVENNRRKHGIVVDLSTQGMIFIKN